MYIMTNRTRLDNHGIAMLGRKNMPIHIMHLQHSQERTLNLWKHVYSSPADTRLSSTQESSAAVRVTLDERDSLAGWLARNQETQVGRSCKCTNAASSITKETENKNDPMPAS